jgi:hypothetical protein
VSVRTIQQAKAAEKAGFGQAVRDGKMSVRKAAELAKLPDDARQCPIVDKSEPQRASRSKRDGKDEGCEHDSLRLTVRRLEVDNETLRTENAELRNRVKELEEQNQELSSQIDCKAAEIAALSRDQVIASSVEESNGVLEKHMYL